MKVSVIIPNYNHEKYLKQRIESVLNQTFKDFEVIILDDSSTDNSKEVISTFASNHHVSNIVYNEINSGSPFSQWKKGIDLAKGEYIWIAESDDFAHQDFLQILVPQFEKSENIGLVYCDSFIINEENQEINRFSQDKLSWLGNNRWFEDYINTGYKEIEEYLAYNCTINNASAVLFRKSSISKLKDNFIMFRYIGDWYFYLNILNQSNIIYLSQPLNYYRKHQNYSLKNEANRLVFAKENIIIFDYLIKKYPKLNRSKLYQSIKKGTTLNGIFSNALVRKYYLFTFKVNRRLFAIVIKNLITDFIYEKALSIFIKKTPK